MKTYYLIGGGEFEDDIKTRVEYKVLQRFNKPHVLVIPWSSNDPKTLKKYHPLLIDLFRKVGTREIDFLKKDDSFQEMQAKFKKAEVIYLTGGDTETLLENLKAHNVVSLLKDFDGLVMGISAGAYVLTKEYPKIRRNKVTFVPMLSLVDICIKAHYRAEMDEILKHLSWDKNIYAITNNSAAVWQQGKLKETIGEVYLFTRGKKVKCR